MATEKSPSRITVRARLSYVNVFKPYVDATKPDDKPKYKCLLIIDKDDKKSVAAIKAAIAHVEAKMITEKYAGKKPKKAIKNTLVDGDEEKEGEEFENTYCLNVSKHVKPEIFDKRLNPITDEEEIYSGIIANVAIDCYYYFRPDSQGITFSLEAIQKVSDGEPLGASRVRAEDVFEVMDDEDEDEDEDEFDEDELD